MQCSPLAIALLNSHKNFVGFDIANTADIQKKCKCQQVAPKLKRKPKRVPTIYPRAVNSAVPVDMQVVKLIAAAGVCESVLFGMPNILAPTTSFLLGWRELEAQQHRLQAFVSALHASVCTELAFPDARHIYSIAVLTVYMLHL